MLIEPDEPAPGALEALVGGKPRAAIAPLSPLLRYLQFDPLPPALPGHTCGGGRAWGRLSGFEMVAG